MKQSKKIKIGELEFDCRFSGEATGEPVVLLHGFPETSIMWIGLMDYLASIGFYCIAPDMRGYSADACPKGVKNYAMEKLRADILNITDALGIGKFHLIGHDWGAIIGWDIVYNNPEKVISWTALAVPHSKSFLKAYKTDPVQQKKSRYVSLFLLPFIPEFKIRKHDFKGFRRLWKNSSSEEVEHYLSVFRRKSSLTGALNYYRANLGKKKMEPIGNIETPTLYIWGKKDLAVGEVAAKGNEKYMKGDYTFLELEGGHWLIQTNYEELEQAIEKHLTKYSNT
ncbi:alpha/beta fold hydrolase [Flagellimonas sp. S3867]|uniref:alpha/beta fold hydrolase n=1 Tax=Flagellimonas sp. S3867 TaxID=2768063 RepID=UPI0016881A19|nr:alpha/beta hydrolase [Flagellimonas sp. S3867]